MDRRETGRLFGRVLVVGGPDFSGRRRVGREIEYPFCESLTFQKRYCAICSSVRGWNGGMFCE